MATQPVNSAQVDEAHIPASLEDPVLLMTSLTANTGYLPTVFIGVVDTDNYTEEMWKSHATRLSKVFNVVNGYIEIKVGTQEKKVAGVKLAEDIKEAIIVLNNADVDTIRIVGMGYIGAISVLQAIESLVHTWNKPWDQKNVQFIALGDTANSDWLKLCKNMCLKQICRSVAFYLTKDYNSYGRLIKEI